MSTKPVEGLGPLGESYQSVESDDGDDDSSAVAPSSSTSATSFASSKASAMSLEDFHMPMTNAEWYRLFANNFVDKQPSDDMLFYVRPN